MSPWGMRWLGTLSLCGVLFGCVPEDAGVEGRPCPCIAGYMCIEDVCRRPGDGDAPADDASRDSPVADTPRDAARDVARDTPVDAGRDTPADTPDGGADVPVDVPLDVPDDAPADVGVGFCDRHGSGSIVCVDFERDVFMDGWEDMRSGADSVTLIDPSRGFSGRSLRVTAGEGGAASIGRSDLGPVRSGAIWLRARLYVDAEAAAGISYYSFMTLTAFTGVTAGWSTALSGAQHLNQGYYYNAQSDQQIPPDMHPVGEWFCVEMEMRAEQMSEMKLYLNGVDLGTVAMRADAPWQGVAVGATFTVPAQPVATIWIDDFVWSTTRVPCDLE